MDPFDWLDFLKFALRLKAEDDDAAKRTAVSRAYYYAFHLALTRAEHNGYLAPKQMGSHADLWRVYEESPVLECRQLGRMGQRLKEWRVKADYREFFPLLGETVPLAIEEASKFAALLSRTDPRHPKQSSQRH